MVVEDILFWILILVIGTLVCLFLSGLSVFLIKETNEDPEMAYTLTMLFGGASVYGVSILSFFLANGYTIGGGMG